MWVGIVPHMPKSARYTLGTRIENTFLDLLELSYLAYFSERDKKHEKISSCIIRLDTLKYLITIAWEARFISHKHCEDLSLKLHEMGKMFGGWKNSMERTAYKNRTS